MVTNDEDIKTVAVDPGEEKQREVLKQTKSVDALIMLEEENLLLSGSADQLLRFWKPAQGKLLGKQSAGHGS